MQTRRRLRQANRNLLSTALTPTKTEYGFTHLPIPKTLNSRWVRLRSVVMGVTASVSIIKARVRTMVAFRTGSTTEYLFLEDLCPDFGLTN
jgi:hypothetical protein